MEELATHSKPGDYFIALYGQVIDISNFISKHPGGEKILVPTPERMQLKSLKVSGSGVVFLPLFKALQFFSEVFYMFLHLYLCASAIRGIHAGSGGFDLVSKWCPESIVASLSDWKGPAPPLLAVRKYPGSLMLWPAVALFAAGVASGL